MLNLYSKIKKDIENNLFESALLDIGKGLSTNPKDDTLIYLKGCIYSKKQNWQLAIKFFREAQKLNKNSPAVEAEKLLLEIINFYNKDLYNP